MIVGNGLIANLFKNEDRENVVFFASGVSNSLETDKSAFLREENLIRKTIKENPNKIFIYFSTCSIYDSSKNGSSYVNHKLKMERLVEDLAPKYLTQITQLKFFEISLWGNPKFRRTIFCVFW